MAKIYLYTHRYSSNFNIIGNLDILIEKRDIGNYYLMNILSEEVRGKILITSQMWYSQNILLSYA